MIRRDRARRTTRELTRATGDGATDEDARRRIDSRTRAECRFGGEGCELPPTDAMNGKDESNVRVDEERKSRNVFEAALGRGHEARGDG